MNEAKEWLDQLTQTKIPPDKIALQILNFPAGADGKHEKSLRQYAREVLHYSNQLANATTLQWQQSFKFELAQSLKSLKLTLKKLAAQNER